MSRTIIKSFSLTILVLLYCLTNASSESTLNLNYTLPQNATSVNQSITNVSIPVVPLTTTVGSVTTSVPATTPPTEINITSSDKGSQFEWENVDVLDEKNNQTLISNNITSIEEDYHEYYNSTVIQDENTTTLHRTSIYADCSNLTINNLLSKSHRRAMTIRLPFEFPFYGHPITNITIATGGFLYAGDYIHSWLAATQYISPLMANFDTSLSDKSFVKYCENEKSFHVYWEKVMLQNKPDVGNFTFSASLYSNGDIVFAYYFLPIDITKIEDDKHPVKVGVSDAYIIDKTVYHARRKTIFEYHRVNFAGPRISNSTVIRLTPMPTCNSFTDCSSCLENEIKFKCNWCPSLNRCSSGVDRKRQEWTNHGCDKSQISDVKMCSATTENPTSTASPPVPKPADKSSHNASAVTQPAPERSSAGFVTAVCSVLALIVIAVGWVFYAYTHPHTGSGQFLIQYGRPAAWSWRRGEARYTAATIHM